MPMVKHPFVVGFLVAELPIINWAPYSDAFKLDLIKADGLFTSEQITRAVMISRSLATAYVMDQKAMLLQQSSWQNSVRMSHLIEQIRGPLSTIRALTKMMSVHVKKIEISHDIVEDILMQGDNIKDTLQQLQDAVYITKANIVSYDDERIKKVHNPLHSYQESFRSLPSDYSSMEYSNCSAKSMNPLLSLDLGKKDIELQVPPVRLVQNQHHGIG